MLDISPILLTATPCVQPLSHRQIVSIAAHRGQTAALEQIIGAMLPATPHRITHNATTYLWSGPSAWLATSETPGLLATLTAAQPHAAITDQSDGHSLFRVTGPHARTALAKLVPIDLHPSAFAPNAVALTLAGHIGVKVWQDDDGNFILACFRSYAADLHHALVEATQEFGRG